MIFPFINQSIEILFIFILITASFIITKRDLLAMTSTYRIQSFIICIIAVLLYIQTGSSVVLTLAAIILISKVVIIPSFIKYVQKRMVVRRDSEFHYLSPTGAIFVSIFLIAMVYASMSKILHDLSLSNTFLLGAVTGISLTLIGMIIIFSRKQTITNILGYLTMENGVLLLSLFLTEMPLIIEVLIMLDLFMLVLLASMLAFGIDTTAEEFHESIKPTGWFRRKKK